MSKNWLLQRIDQTQQFLVCFPKGAKTTKNLPVAHHSSSTWIYVGSAAIQQVKGGVKKVLLSFHLVPSLPGKPPP